MERIIFHIPEQIDKKRASASQLRPQKLLHAFLKQGYLVDIVSGYGKERKKQIKQIKQNIENGIHYSFLYSESSTMPTLLTERDHFPRYPFLDFSFFAFCKKHEIRIGLFYRDIYWRFFDEPLTWKQWVSIFFYKYDLMKYKKLVDVLFIPSLEMKEYIPFKFCKEIISLPSGLDVNIIAKKSISHNFRILYIGGIGEHYNLEMLVKVVMEIPNICLTICCREDDWVKVKDKYEPYISEKIVIVHKKGLELITLYQEADIFSLFVEPSEYRKFAVPFKLFESIGFGCPILASEGTWVANFVKTNKIGLVCEYSCSALKETLEKIVENKFEYQNNISYSFEDIAKKNSWTSRVLQITNSLLRC